MENTSKGNSIIIGLLFGFSAILGGFFLEGGQFSMLFLLPALMIVVGGTIAAGIIGHSVGLMLTIPTLIKVAMRPVGLSLHLVIEEIYEYSVVARRNGFVALEKELPNVKHPLLAKLLRIIIDGAEEKDLREMADTEIAFITERHRRNIGLFTKLGGYSPTMGIIGTVMGLIATLAAVGGDPNDLIRHIAAAFIATFWGILLANTIWLPIADKLRLLHDEEMTLFEVFLEGAVGIQRGDTPSALRARLAGVLPLSRQSQFFKVSPAIKGAE